MELWVETGFYLIDNEEPISSQRIPYPYFRVISMVIMKRTL